MTRKIERLPTGGGSSTGGDTGGNTGGSTGGNTGGGGDDDENT